MAAAPGINLRGNPAPAVLAQRLHSPLCGIITDVSSLVRTRYGPAVFLYSGELTGVHMWSNRPDPPPGSFHLGGFGVHRGEALVKLLGESVERYSGHAVLAAGRFPVRMASHARLAADGEPVLAAEDFTLFRSEQLARAQFPFQPFAPEALIGWITVSSLLDGAQLTVPAQAFLLGYVVKPGEPWLQTAVTTGTAVYPEPGRALLAALEELIQVDAAIGHWHGRTASIRIISDRRTARVDRIIARHVWKHTPPPEFHLLPSPDMPGFVCACLLRAPGDVIPRIAIGLGAGAALDRAMYRAFLEAAGVQWLATWVAIREPGRPDASAVAQAHDLESNVGYYAGPDGADIAEKRFSDCQEISAADAAPDGPTDPRQAAARIVGAFRAAGKRVYHADFTTPDIRLLGLSVQRVWSPDLIALPLPSAPPLAHPRFAAYGGVTRDDPHPYP